MPVTHMVLHDVVVQSGDNLTKYLAALQLPAQDVVKLMQQGDKALLKGIEAEANTTNFD